MRICETLTTIGLGLCLAFNAPRANAQTTAPNAPTAVASGSDRITLTWLATDLTVSGFKIERSLKPNTNFRVVAKLGTGAGVRIYQDAGLAASTTYYYRLRSVYGTRASSPSGVASATTLPVVALAAATATRTATPVPTVTRTPSATTTATRTAPPTAAVTPVPTVTVTRTSTPVPTVTATATRTTTPLPTPTATSTSTPLPTATATRTTTPFSTATATRTTTPLPTATTTRTPVPTGTVTPTPTGAPTRTSTPIRTGTPTPTPTATGTFDPMLIGFVPGIGSAQDVSVTATTALVASDFFGLSRIDISDPRTPTLNGTPQRSFTGGRVAAHGARAVVTGVEDGFARLWVLDVGSAPPYVMGELATTVSSILDVAINDAGTVAVTAMGTMGIWVVDLSNPAHPVRRSVYDTAGTAFAVALNVSGSLAYVADGSGGLKVFDIGNLSAPTQVGSLSPGGIERSIVLQSGIAYLADQTGRLVTVDITTPNAPRQLGAVTIGRYTFDVAVEGSRAITHSADSVSYLDVIDVTSPSAPVVQGSTAVDTAGGIKGIAIANGRAFVADGPQGLKVYDLGATPQQISGLKDDFTASHVAVTTGVTVVTGAYLPTNTARLRVIDTSDPTLPRIVGELPTSVAAAGILDVAMNDASTVAVTAMGAAGVWVVDLSTPAAPVRRGVFDTAGTAFAVALDPSGSLAYVADGSGGLKIISLANPSAPSQVGNLAISGVQRDVAIQNGIAYLADQSGHLVTIDVATPSAPRQLGTLVIGRATFNVAVHGTLAVTYSADSASYLDVIDVTSPSSPVKVGSVAVDAAGSVKALAMDAGHAYVADGTQGLKIYALDDPSAPTLVGSGYAVGDAADVAITGDTAQAADSAAHVSIVDLFAP